MTSPPPTLPLFPYTTLFRSYASLAQHAYPVLAELGFTATTFLITDYIGKTNTWDVRDQERDRKSTRLNSSHRTISYAVFCLKKQRHSNALSVTRPIATAARA